MPTSCQLAVYPGSDMSAILTHTDENSLSLLEEDAKNSYDNRLQIEHFEKLDELHDTFVFAMDRVDVA